MSLVVELGSRPSLLVLALVTLSAAGCAESDRFLDSQYANSGRPEMAVAPQRGQAGAPVGRVQSAQLPPPGAGRPAPLDDYNGAAGGNRPPNNPGPAPYEPPPPQYNAQPASYAPAAPQYNAQPASYAP